MPWSIKQDERCPAGEPWGVVKDDDGSLEGCHSSEAAAHKQMAALYASEGMMPRAERPPRDQLVRSQSEYRLDDAPEIGPMLVGRLAVFNQWTRIESAYEGRFMERIAPGAFRKAIGDWRANPNSVRVTFNHGKDPHLGDKVLGVPESIDEDDAGVPYAVPLFDTSYNRDLLPGLKAGAYGSSFRFRVVEDDWIKRPELSDSNPDALPERTIKALQLFEFGPVTYPAYAGATAGIRSLTDDYIRLVLGTAPAIEAAPAHPDDGSTEVDEPPTPEPVAVRAVLAPIGDAEWRAYLERKTHALRS